jgi:hypothetical protein
MAYLITDARIGSQDIAEASTTQKHPLGERIRAFDPTFGWGEFVYVKGVASLIVGSLATYSPFSGVTALPVARGKGTVGVAMALINLTTLFGWLQIYGTGVVAVNGAVVSGATVYLTATAGKVDDAVVAGDIVYNATFASADGTPAANFAEINLHYPYVGDTDNA